MINFAINKTGRSIAVHLGGERKVRTTQSAALPNGKVPILSETASATENNRHDLS
jgi:hypothetical protein